jgi:hypothetical protein
MKGVETSRSFSIDDDAFLVMNPTEGARSPEERLMLAVLERAIRDYIGGAPEERDDAEEWLFADDDPTTDDREVQKFEPFSFPWICHVLDLNGAQILKRIVIAAEQSKSGTLPFFLDKRFVDRGREPEGRPQRGGRRRRFDFEQKFDC